MALLELKNISSWYQTLKLDQEANSPLLRWSIFAISTILIWFIIIEPLQSWRQSLFEQLEQNARTAVRLSALQEQGGLWEKAESEARVALEGEMQALFMHPSDTAAQAEIQSFLRQQSAALNITVKGQRVIAVENYPEIGRKLGVAMDINGELIDILKLLDVISHAPNLLHLDRWYISMNRDQTALAQIVISGFRGGVDQVADEF